MPRSPSRSYGGASFSFGPSSISQTLKILIGANVAMFLAQRFAPYDPSTQTDFITGTFGLMPAAVVGQLRVWQLATYLFLHVSLLHILFNMLALWLFGTELERMWGTRYFLKFYFVTGIGAGALTVLVSLLPFGFAEALRHSVVIGASGAIFGLLLAYALYFPDRQIYMYLLFPIPAKYFVLIIGAITLYSSIGESGVANVTHLGGLLVAYLYLKGGSMDPIGEAKYRFLKWKIARTRKKFDVYSGGRSVDDWNKRVH